MTWKATIENLATLAAICFLCWFFQSYWGLVLMMNLISPVGKSKRSNVPPTSEHSDSK